MDIEFVESMIFYVKGCAFVSLILVTLSLMVGIAMFGICVLKETYYYHKKIKK